MTDYSELRRLLTATIGINGPIFDMDGPGELCRLASFVAEQPELILTLLKDLDVATSVGKALGITLANVVESRDALVSAIAALREDLEHAQRQPLYSTRRDAERYRFLRSTECWDDLDSHLRWGGPLPSIAPQLYIVASREEVDNQSGELLDRAIDFFMAQAVKHD